MQQSEKVFISKTNEEAERIRLVWPNRNCTTAIEFEVLFLILDAQNRPGEENLSAEMQIGEYERGHENP